MKPKPICVLAAGLFMVCAPARASQCVTGESGMCQIVASVEGVYAIEADTQGLALPEGEKSLALAINDTPCGDIRLDSGSAGERIVCYAHLSGGLNYQLGLTMGRGQAVQSPIAVRIQEEHPRKGEAIIVP